MKTSSCRLQKLRAKPELAKRDARQGGFSLIEVLISIIILSFGLLGMVGLQAAALQANRDARLQSVATTLARELAEMMRGNKDQAMATVNNPYVGSYPRTTGAAWEPASKSFCLTVGNMPCANATAVAQAEMTQWLAKVSTELPGARVEICSDDSPFDANGLPEWSTCAAPPNATVMLKIGWTRNTTNKSNVGDQAFDRASRPSVIFAVTAGNV